MNAARVSHTILLLAACAAAGCKTIPSDSYGIARLRFHGVDQLDDAALRACLATRERQAFEVDVGTSSELECNVPPFDGGRLPIRLVTWPWTEWPTFDEAVFERDLDRVERWYRARGFYDARVERTNFDPPHAGESDELPPVGQAPCERRRAGEGCRLQIDVYVHEGEPVHIRHLVVTGHETLGRETRHRILDAVELHEGARFDEALHDRTKVAMITAMRESGYACADVRGQVDLDPEQRIADVSYAVLPGIPSRFHDVRVEVNGDARGIPLDVVKSVSGLEPGMQYAPSHITSAQRDVYALGAFSAVEVEAVPVRADGSEAASARACTGQVDVIIRVTPGRAIRYGIGAGIDSGTFNYLTSTSGLSSTQGVAQWNVHLLARFEHRNLFGGLRRLRIEERPKIVFQAPFPEIRPANCSAGDTACSTSPGANNPRPGNELSFEFRQPAFLERAITFTIPGRWDLGPDPVYGNVRHLVDVGGALQRPFLAGHISASVGVYGNAYHSVTEPPTGTTLPNYALSFLRQYVLVDYRDDPRVSRRGASFSVDVHEAGTARLAPWSYLRVISEVRAFIPLPARFTIAGRFLMGGMYIYDHPGSSFGDAKSALLGPTAYRLRGGGPTSHRGFVAGTLGDVVGDYQAIDGGIAKWEASLEVRARITDSFGAVLFGDAGDVNRSLSWRFNQPHLALGFGIRYYTIIGPLRLDFGFRPRGMQVFGSGVDLTPHHSMILSSRVQGAISLTIGEAF